MPHKNGMDSSDETILTVVERFNHAINNQNLSEVLASLTEDTIFDNTFPAPDGTLYEGREVVSGFWEAFFRASPQARFEFEETFACGDRCVVRWKYYWIDKNGQSGRIRGVDIFKVRDGKISEKLSYVKG